MSESEMYAAIWPVDAVKKDQYLSVPSCHIKNFHPSDVKDFDPKQVYKYKPPSAVKSSGVFILALAGKYLTLTIFHR